MNNLETDEGGQRRAALWRRWQSKGGSGSAAAAVMVAVAAQWRQAAGQQGDRVAVTAMAECWRRWQHGNGSGNMAAASEALWKRL